MKLPSVGLMQVEELSVELARTHEELSRCGEALNQARLEGVRAAETIAGWEEAFSAAQAELEALRSAATQQQQVSTARGFACFSPRTYPCLA